MATSTPPPSSDFLDCKLLKILILYLGKFITLTISLLTQKHIIEVKSCVINVKLVLYILNKLLTNYVMDEFSEYDCNTNV
jgi:hypothetical protein